MQETVTAGATNANGGQHHLEHAMSDVDLGFDGDALPVANSPGGSMHGTKCALPGAFADASTVRVLPSRARLLEEASRPACPVTRAPLCRQGSVFFGCNVA